MKKLQWHQSLAVIALFALLLTNVLIGQYIIQAVLFAYESVLDFGSHIGAVSLAYLIGYFVWVDRSRENRVPPKTHKSKVKSSEYIKT